MNSEQRDSNLPPLTSPDGAPPTVRKELFRELTDVARLSKELRERFDRGIPFYRPRSLSRP